MQCKNYAAPATCSTSRPFKIVVVGHVDHGKSTLIGRWLIEGGLIAADRLSKVEKVCAEKGIPFEPAFLLDAFEEEQNQGVSIDSTRAQMEFGGQRYLFIDVPGHLEFLKNMTSGASDAELGLLVIDAAEGMQAQTSIHLQVLSIFGIDNIVVAINKIDKIGYSADKFAQLKHDSEELLRSLRLKCVGVIPIVALSGENVLLKSENMDWYGGGSLLGTIAAQATDRSSSPPAEQFRMLLQDVYKLHDERYLMGLIVSGSVVAGDSIYFSPSGKCSKIESIAKFPDLHCVHARKGESIAIKLVEQVYVERGEVISRADQAPEVDTQLRATVVWLSPNPLRFGSEYLLKLGTAEVTCSINYLTASQSTQQAIVNGEVLDVLIKLQKPVAFDRTSETGGINRFVLCSTYETVAAGVIDSPNSPTKAAPRENVQPESGYLSRATYEDRHGHKGTVLWLTGLSGSGKSTLAKELEKDLFDKGYRALVLDADTLRTGVCADLGFTPEERSENIRRISELAKLFANRGFIVIVACLSPYRRDREMARNIIGAPDFNEIFISCPLEICQSRDPKGLYQKAAQGALKSFSGVDSPYQIPLKPALLLASNSMSLKDELELVLHLLKQNHTIQNPPFEQ